MMQSCLVTIKIQCLYTHPPVYINVTSNILRKQPSSVDVAKYFPV